MKVRTLASALHVSETNIRNYTTKDSKPSFDILERVVQQYPQVHALWLLTGSSELFILPANENNQTTAHAEKKFRSPVVETNYDTAYQENNATLEAADVEAIKVKLALVEQENEHLKAQLAMNDALLTSKEETLALLRISYNRPN